MSEASEHLHRTVDDLERRLAESGAQLGRAREAAAVVAGVRGSARSEDGHVHAEWAQGALTDLTVHPRALRGPAEDLAATIRATVTAAIDDHRRRTLEALRDAGLAPDPDEVRASLERARGQLGTAQDDLARSLRAALEAAGRASRR